MSTSWIRDNGNPDEPAEQETALGDVGEVIWQMSHELHRMIRFGEDSTGLVIDETVQASKPTVTAGPSVTVPAVYSTEALASLSDDVLAEAIINLRVERERRIIERHERATRSE